MENPEKIDYFF